MREQVFAKEVKVFRRCVSGGRPDDSFTEDVEGQATHVLVARRHSWRSLFADDRFLGAIQIQLVRLYKRPVPSADSPRLSLTLSNGLHNRLWTVT